jgi:hypothetical protein
MQKEHAVPQCKMNTQYHNTTMQIDEKTFAAAMFLPLVHPLWAEMFW